MIIEVQSKKQIKQFIYFVTDLYKGEEHYVFPIFSAQKKELNEIVLQDKTYRAILSVNNNQEVNGRLLYTYEYSKKQDKKICYYSYFDVINDYSVVEDMFGHMEQQMRRDGINYSEGTFSPFDPDTRRGVMIKGFEYDPSIFTSYNYEYYGTLLEQYGYSKAIDTVLLNADVNARSKKKLNTFSKYFLRSHNVRIDSINYKDIDRDLKDIEQILKVATNEIVYQDAPDFELLEKTARQMKAFINPNLVKIAREVGTEKPVGFCLVFPDLNQIFKQTKGKIRPIKMMLLKRKITRARGAMQYIVPEYQNTGLIGHLFKVIFEDLVKAGITEFEAGTMMEDNPRPINAFKKFGGEIIKVYRLYGKELS